VNCAEVAGSVPACGRRGVCVVKVRGTRPRTGPGADRYNATCGGGAQPATAGGRPGYRGTDTEGGHLTNRWITRWRADEDGPGLDVRLRATWLADCAGALGLATFMHAARDQLTPSGSANPGRRDGAGGEAAVRLPGRPPGAMIR